ncbi:uncharacterized protein [Antedon mediterranea]|uniref:uncharacterized protein n=1 Tax=Antedon mediterranea TaxID=105859 RepID=UPI003AF52FA9
MFTTEIPSSWGDFCVKFNYYLGDSNDYIEIHHYRSFDHWFKSNTFYFKNAEWKQGLVSFTTAGTHFNRLQFHARTYRNIVAINNVNISRGACENCVDNIYLTTSDVINITSPYYPQNYGTYHNCEWTVESPQNTGILLTFYVLELSTCCDFLYITYVNTIGNTVTEYITGTEYTDQNSIVAKTNIIITFQSNGYGFYTGFALGLKVIGIDIERLVIECPTNVTSNNYIGEGNGLVIVSTDIGSRNATVIWDPPVTSDNETLSIISSPYESGDMIPIGIHTITFTATDSFGSIDTCDFGLQVEDNKDPVLVCPPNITTTTADGSEQAVNVNWTDPIVIDNSGEDITPTSKYNPGNNEFDIGSTDVIYDVVDSSSNAATCTFTVTVTDPEAPDIIDCPIGMIVNTTTGEAFAINVTWMEPTATDNSGETPIPVTVYTSGDNKFPIGDTTVQYNVSDSAGNFNDSCSFAITVQDEQDPVFKFCPDSIFTETDHRTSTARVSWKTPEIEDNSGQVSLVASASPGSVFNIGTTSVVYTASDNSNNINKCDFNVTVEDNEPPVLECPDDIIDIATTTSGIVITWPDPSFIDNSGKSVILSSTSNSGDIFTFGTHTVFYTGFDQSKNSGTCQFEIKIGDLCTSSPCQNGGTCVQLETSFACNCPVLYEGNLCQILPGEPTAEIQPLSLSANLKNTVTFQCIVTYSINWRWYKDNIELPSETQRLKFLTINEVGLANQGYYYCKAFGVSPHDGVTDISMKAVLVVTDAFTVPTVLTFKNLQFTSALNNPSSEEFKNTSTEIENYLTESIIITDIFVQVRTLRSGSVIANINIYKPSADQSYNNFSKSLSGEIKIIGDKGVIDADNIIIFSTESCNVEIIDGLTFGLADVGQNTPSDEVCPESKINYGMPLGLCTCYSDGLSAAVWQDVILQDCGRDATSDELLERLNTITVTEENAEEVITAVNNITTTESDTITPDGLEATAEIIESVTSVNSTSAEVTSTLVGTVASLFEVDDDVLLESQMQTQAPSRIVESLEQQLAVVDLKNDKYEFVTSSVAVQAQSVKTNELDYTGIGIASYQSADTSAIVNVTGFSKKVELNNAASVSIYIPPTITKMFAASNGTSDFRVVTVIYNDSSLFPTNQSNNATRTNGQIISLSIPGVKLNNLSDPIVTTFIPAEISKKNNETACVFWDFELDDGNGGWSSAGCYLANGSLDGSDRQICHCDHLTNFAILMNFYPGQEDTPFPRYITNIGLGVSIVCLLATLVSFTINRKLRKSKPKQILCHLCVSLLCLYLIFLVGIDRKDKKGSCTAIAGLIHYFLLTSMFWMSVQAINLYYLIVQVYNTHVSRFFLKACLFAWGLPAVIVAITVGIDVDNYANKDYCFLVVTRMYYSVALPIAIVLLFNMIVFIMVLRSISKLGKITAQAHEHNKSRHLLQNAACISVIMGLTWVIGFFAIGSAANEIQILFCILNSFQGFAIFVLYCLRSKDVRIFWTEEVRKRFYGVSSTLRGTKSSSVNSSTGRTTSFGLNSSKGEQPNSDFKTNSSNNQEYVA